ncbi:E3 ubiquitin-protein ligase TRIM39-like [Carcharodon carcharias]|uniref:E3 ubiquitin-protein ligase TRIM39-like n=1 Tax=Carcharodon carcharias TaxID=13397 RepID=UPI001B7DFD33|nr:E3 ubiquitin-protein ligase TRIM39-like [Carcharodon carcharias]
MACEEEINKLKEQVTCALCGQLFKEPVTMGCGHTSCKDCLNKIVIGKDGKVSCPTCSADCSPVDIVDNELATKLVETLKKILELKPDVGDDCQKHNLPYTVFCLDDMRLMCDKMAKEHPNCRTIPIKEAAERFKEKLQQALENLETVAKENVGRDEQMNLIDLKNQGDKVRDKIETAFISLRKYLEKEEIAVMAQVETQEERFLQELEESSAGTGGNPVTIDHLTGDIRKQLTQEDIPLLKNISTIFDRTGRLVRKPKEMPIDLSQGGFNLPLQYAVWKRTLKYIDTVPTAVTLNPLTANAHLILSRDGTEVRVGDKQEDIPDNPERFSRWLSVLGSQGFTSGRHTWEVEVGDSTIWQVGVAKGSVPRKRGFAPFHWQESRKFFTPEPQAGVWALALQDGDYTALTSPPVQLLLKGKLRMLGVYLDYAAGQVSFYNSDEMTHLHTFKDKFTEAIFPYFYIAHKGDSLKLHTLGL